ncbi:hypothetical protein jhhlp_008314 [Lomentospora prolificans]|uniref:C2H2-type domain-containing protein n=1 Tax=Lomentospora prolificans TaxID=41688 RepID=A0A2N3MXP2_9PEZI|nr:hypothetical protein jhhlp_008314 [Lomentospora prolificans]
MSEPSPPSPPPSPSVKRPFSPPTVRIEVEPPEAGSPVWSKPSNDDSQELSSQSMLAPDLTHPPELFNSPESYTAASNSPPAQRPSAHLPLSPRPSTTHLGWASDTSQASYSRSRASSDASVYNRPASDTYDYVQSPTRLSDMDEHSYSAIAGNKHFCEWASCPHPPFHTREDLIWHVKDTHLLICPLPGCTGAPFSSQNRLREHMGNHDVLRAKSAAKRKKKGVQDIVRLGLDIRIARIQLFYLKEETSVLLDEVLKPRMADVNNYKRDCQKRLATTAGFKNDMTPFAVLWESCILPFLSKFIGQWYGPGHTIGVLRGKGTGPNPREICITTKTRVSRARTLVIVRHVQDLLLKPYRDSTKVTFSEGRVVRARWARGLDKSRPDAVCDARNPHRFEEPCMGDSIGIEATPEYEEETATLGPRITVGGQSYWLANFHPFVNASNALGLEVQHPSPADRRLCSGKQQNLAGPTANRAFTLGRLSSTSGTDLTATRISNDPYWQMHEDYPRVVMDWSLITASDSGRNYLRTLPPDKSFSDKPFSDIHLVTASSHVKPEAEVVASGRTSGLQRGRICEIPMYVNGDEDGNETGTVTREWFVEALDLEGEDDEWIQGGVGVKGDSGAAIVDAKTSVLYGQLWGRNADYGPGARVAFFTPIQDILDDIAEKCGSDTPATLAQAKHGDLEQYPVYPTCCRGGPTEPGESEANLNSQAPTSVAVGTNRSERSPEPVDAGPTAPARRVRDLDSELIFRHMGPPIEAPPPVNPVKGPRDGSRGVKRVISFGTEEDKVLKKIKA